MAKSVAQMISEAKSHAKCGDLDTARQLYQEILDKYPNNRRSQQGLIELISARPDNSKKSPPSREQIDFLVVLYTQGALSQALEHGQMMIDHYRESIVVYNILGLTHSRLGRVEEAVALFRRAIERNRHYGAAHYNLGNELNRLGRKDEAIVHYERALKIDPHDASAHNNLGVALFAIGRKEDAIARYEQALKIRPAYSDAHVNLGNALNDLGRKEDAISSYENALSIDPREAIAHNNMGIALQDLGRQDEAIACYETALKINPNYSDARAQRLAQLGELCDWDAIRAQADTIPVLGIKDDAVAPFSLLAFEDDPARHRMRSELAARRHFYRRPLPVIHRPKSYPDRLRVGYFSADFGDHAVMRLMKRLFEVHDRERFSVYAYSFGPDRNDAVRQRLRSSFDCFRDVRLMSDQEVAELARQDAIQIAVDLNGYTKGTRLGIFAYRAAPVQMSYLGYPGTTGAPFIDYLVADKIVIPPEQRQHYSERIIFLPNSYQVNDNTQEISDRAWTRQAAGLPEKGFVFCCMNSAYKISPSEFEIWMRLLHHIDGSVLWASKPNRWALERLVEQAKRRGIASQRIVFAEKLPDIRDHLARLGLADLFLDTFNFNAHTTASDALWAGLPVLTKLGKGFASRVAGSLLAAAGLPELMTLSPRAYEDLALGLARDPVKLYEIKAKLLSRRHIAPLFNTELFVRHIEDAYQQAYQCYYSESEPGDILVRS